MVPLVAPKFKVGSFVAAVTVTGLVPSPTEKNPAVVMVPLAKVKVGDPAPLGANIRIPYVAAATVILLVCL